MHPKDVRDIRTKIIVGALLSLQKNDFKFVSKNGRNIDSVTLDIDGKNKLIFNHNAPFFENNTKVDCPYGLSSVLKFKYVNGEMKVDYILLTNDEIMEIFQNIYQTNQKESN